MQFNKGEMPCSPFNPECKKNTEGKENQGEVRKYVREVMVECGLRGSGVSNVMEWYSCIFKLQSQQH